MKLSPRDSRGVAPAIFMIFLGLYLLGTSGFINTPDGVIMYRVTKNLVSEGRLDIDELSVWPGFGGMHHSADQSEPLFYSKYGLGLSLAAIPTYLIGKALLPMADARQANVFSGTIHQYYDTSPRSFDQVFLSWTASWTNSFVVAACVAGVFLVCRELNFGIWISIFVAAASGLLTPLWHYSKTFFAEPLAACGLLYFFLFSLRGRYRNEPVRWWSLAGLMLAVAAAAKILHVVILIPALIFLVGYSRHMPRRAAIEGLIAAGVGYLTLFSIILIYNFARFRNIFETGYGHETGSWTFSPLDGALGLLVSPGRGLILYFPLCLLAALGMKRFAERFKLELFFILACPALLVGIYANWYMWEGGWCWGPRFLIPTVPLLMIPVASFCEEAAKRRFLRLVGWFVGTLALVVSINGLFVNFIDFSLWVKWVYTQNAAFFQSRGTGNYYDLLRWGFGYSPLVRHWTFPVRQYFLFPRALEEPGLVLILHVIFGAVSLVGAVLLWRATRGFSRAHRKQNA